MSIVPCRTRGCPHSTREGYQGAWGQKTGDGSEAADGVFCWRCRREQRTSDDKKRARERQKDEKA